MRSVLGATIVAVTLPVIDTCGAAVTYFLYAVVIWMSYGYVVLFFFLKKIKQNGFAK